MNSIFKKNFLILLLFLIVFSSSSYVVFADDETFDNGTVNKSQTYDYASGLSEIFVWYDDVSSCYVSKTGYWVGSKSFDFNFSGDYSKNILGLRLVGGFLIDGGVNKYAVQIIDGEIKKEYDVYNSASEGNLSDKFELSPTEDYSNFEENCMFDVDIYLEKYCGKKISINLIAYTNNSQVYTVVRLTNLEIASEDGDFVLQSGNLLCCRYCIKETENDIVRFEKYNYMSCLNEYICSECNRSNIFLTPHDFNEVGECPCGANGHHICEWNFNHSIYLYGESDCKQNIYHCFYCEDTYDEVFPHDLKYVGTTDVSSQKDACFINKYKCNECNMIFTDPVKHNYVSGVCSLCGFIEAFDIDSETEIEDVESEFVALDEFDEIIDNKTVFIPIFLVLNLILFGFLISRKIFKKY